MNATTPIAPTHPTTLDRSDSVRSFATASSGDGAVGSSGGTGKKKKTTLFARTMKSIFSSPKPK